MCVRGKKRVELVDRRIAKALDAQAVRPGRSGRSGPAAGCGRPTCPAPWRTARASTRGSAILALGSTGNRALPSSSQRWIAPTREISTDLPSSTVKCRHGVAEAQHDRRDDPQVAKAWNSHRRPAIEAGHHGRHGTTTHHRGTVGAFGSTHLPCHSHSGRNATRACFGSTHPTSPLATRHSPPPGRSGYPTHPTTRHSSPPGRVDRPILFLASATSGLPG